MFLMVFSTSLAMMPCPETFWLLSAIKKERTAALDEVLTFIAQEAFAPSQTIPELSLITF